MNKSILIFLVILLGGCDQTPELGVYVNQNSKSDPSKYQFNTISEALDYLSENPSIQRMIHLAPGRYNEKLLINIDGLNIIGDSKETTIISYGNHGDSKDHDGNRLGTSGSATLTIDAKDVIFKNITIENSFNYPENASKDDNDPTKVKSTQAVAVLIKGRSDRTSFSNVKMSGFQDTFYADAGRTYITSSIISGHVDFIFGAGQLVIENSEIISRNRIGKDPTGYVTAPSTLAADKFGMLIQNCKFNKEDDTVPAGSVRIGRPWHPNANPYVSGALLIRDSFMDDHFGSEGYARISSRNENGERIWFEVGPCSRFYESKNYGPGALISDSRPQLPDSMEYKYTKENILNGWKPELQ